jgi:hypothetical protein
MDPFDLFQQSLRPQKTTQQSKFVAPPLPQQQQQLQLLPQDNIATTTQPTRSALAILRTDGTGGNPLRQNAPGPKDDKPVATAASVRSKLKQEQRDREKALARFREGEVDESKKKRQNRPNATVTQGEAFAEVEVQVRRSNRNKGSTITPPAPTKKTKHDKAKVEGMFGKAKKAVAFAKSPITPSVQQSAPSPNVRNTFNDAEFFNMPTPPPAIAPEKAKKKKSSRNKKAAVSVDPLDVLEAKQHALGEEMATLEQEIEASTHRLSTSPYITPRPVEVLPVQHYRDSDVGNDNSLQDEHEEQQLLRVIGDHWLD